MRRSLLLLIFPALLLSMTAAAQQNGSLTLTVQQMAGPGLPSVGAPVAGAKVIVVHWASEIGGARPTLMRDQTATTNQMGQCVISLPPGSYDIFVAASESAPAAFRREIKAGENSSLTANLHPAETQLRPLQ
jgi:uncharacterized protein (DUF2141 family)